MGTKTKGPPAARKPPKNEKPPRKHRATGRPRGAPPRTLFQPGNKAAVGHGRPRLPPEYKAAFEIMEPEAWAALRGVLANPRHPRHEQAAEYVINRRRGTPTARTEVSGPGGGPVTVENLTTAERVARLNQLIDEANEMEGGEPGEEPDPDAGETA